MNLFRPPVTAIPDCEHIRNAGKSIRHHVTSINTVGEDIDYFFKKSLFAFAKTSPSTVAPIYKEFIKSGVKYAESFGLFVKSFGPTLKTVSDLQSKYDIVQARFDRYCEQVRVVRDEETKENIALEEKKLLNFVKKYTEFNADSNSFIVAFLSVYTASCGQLSKDTKVFLDEITKQIEEYAPGGPTKEEKDLDTLIEKLEKEVAGQKNV